LFEEFFQLENGTTLLGVRSKMGSVVISLRG